MKTPVNYQKITKFPIHSKMLGLRRSRIHGSTDILEHLNEFMFEELGIKKKKLQTDSKIPKAKTLYFQSYKDIECILKYIGVSETLEMLYSFDLGFHDADEFAETHLWE